jgi:hypothetical protein
MEIWEFGEARRAGSGRDFPTYFRCLACEKHTPARPIREFRYNPMRTGEMAEWLKAAVC